MLYSYFISTLRHLAKRRWYSAVNIIGLTLGLSAAAIVILYTRHELSYDGFHRQADRIYRVSGRQEGIWFAPLSAPYSQAIYQRMMTGGTAGEYAFPEVEMVARIRRWPPRFIRQGQDKFYEPNTFFTDAGSDFFHLFDFPFLAGSPAEALKKPHSVVLTSSLATKLFGKVDALGQSLLYDTFRLLVTGIVQDLPSNTHFKFNMLIAEDAPMKNASAMFTYCLLSRGTDLQTLKHKILSIPRPANHFAVMEDATITPLTDIHFESNNQYEIKPPGNRLYFYLFLLTGVLIILLTCANYMNLSIALYAGRKKEIAVRKVAGAGGIQLAIQFLVEAVVLALICLPLTITIVELILPSFNTFMNTQLENEFASSMQGLGWLTAATLLIGMLSGSYPAWVLPRIKAISLFRRPSLAGRSGLSLRQALVGLQITVLVVMLSSSWMIRNQLQYMQETDLGFTRQGVLKLKGAGMVDSMQFYTLKNELLRNSAIRKVSQGMVPGDEEYGFPFKADSGTDVHQGVISFGTDYDYLSTLGVKLLSSDFRDLSKEYPRRVVLVNETMVRQLGYKDPIGRRIVMEPGKGERVVTIDGVFKDFHFSSFHHPVPPMQISMRPYGGGIYNNILILMDMSRLKETLAFINEKTQTIISDTPLTPEFLDEGLDKLYDKEEKLFFLNKVLLLVNVCLSVLGLLGLSAYLSELRTKEIGIRKVLGASRRDIIRLMGWSFLKMAIWAILVGWALAALFIHQWMKNFAYRAPFPWAIPIGTSAALIGLILLSVMVNTLRAARANPVKSLRTE